MLFSTRVLEFWVMGATNVYDFLNFVSLIKNRPNVDFGGNLTFAHIATIFSFLFFSQRKWRKVHKQISN
jgi:hypothetical protein